MDRYNTPYYPRSPPMRRSKKTLAIVVIVFVLLSIVGVTVAMQAFTPQGEDLEVWDSTGQIGIKGEVISSEKISVSYMLQTTDSTPVYFLQVFDTGQHEGWIIFCQDGTQDPCNFAGHQITLVLEIEPDISTTYLYVDGSMVGSRPGDYASITLNSFRDGLCGTILCFTSTDVQGQNPVQIAPRIKLIKETGAFGSIYKFQRYSPAEDFGAWLTGLFVTPSYNLVSIKSGLDPAGCSNCPQVTYPSGNGLGLLAWMIWVFTSIWIVLILIFNLIISIGMYTHAKKNWKNEWLWAILGFIFGIPAAIVYVILYLLYKK